MRTELKKRARSGKALNSVAVYKTSSTGSSSTSKCIQQEELKMRMIVLSVLVHQEMCVQYVVVFMWI